MTGCGITVKIKTPCFLKYTMQFNDTNGHHRQICHHVVFAKEPAHRAQYLRGAIIPRLHGLIERLLGMFAPMPSILKRLYLRTASMSSAILEEQVVIRVAIEGGIEIDEIDALRGNALTEHGEIIAVVQR